MQFECRKIDRYVLPIGHKERHSEFRRAPTGNHSGHRAYRCISTDLRWHSSNWWWILALLCSIHWQADAAAGIWKCYGGITAWTWLAMIWYTWERFRRCSANIIIQYYLVPCRLSTDPKIHDLEWPWNLEWSFYVKFSLLRTAFQQSCYIFTVKSVYNTHVTIGDVRKRTLRLIRRIFGIRWKAADLS